MRTDAMTLLGVALGALSACDDPTPTAEARSATPHHAHTATSSSASAAASASVLDAYTCPMHPDVKQLGPGECPLCGMALVKDEGPPVASSVPALSATPAAGATGRYELGLSAPRLEPGRSTEVTVRFSDPKGHALSDTDFKVAHEQRVHLLIIDESLTDYHHEHPTRVEGGDGALRFDFVPTKPGPYRVFADVIPNATRRQAYLMADLTSAAPRGEPISEREVALRTKLDGLDVEIQLPATVAKGKPLDGTLVVRGADGAVVRTLEPVMGAYAHLVGFYEDRTTVEHIHPMGPEPTRATDRGEGTLRFRTTPQKAGLMRLFAQFKLDGKERFARFTLQIAE